MLFQSTHPSWGATLHQYRFAMYYLISIHAPIVGCDKHMITPQSERKNFNPRTHRGVRRRIEFLVCSMDEISIHAPIVGCDVSKVKCNVSTSTFQSTHPSWGATSLRDSHQSTAGDFNPRTHRGVRPCAIVAPPCDALFQSTHPSWGATFLLCCSQVLDRLFQSTHPSWGATSLFFFCRFPI